MLSNHKFDINNKNKQYHKHPKANNKNEDKEGKDNTPLSFAQMEGSCYCCGKPGHKYPDWKTNYKVKQYEWVINKAQQHVQSNIYDNKSKSGSSLSSKKEYLVIVWGGLHCSFAQ